MLDKSSTLLQDNAAPNGETIGDEMQWIVISPAGPVRYPTQWEAQSTAAAMGWSYRRERLSDQPLGGDDLPAFQCANNECEWVALPVPQPACDECGAPNVAL